MGSPEMSDPLNVFIAAQLGITILSVDYRLAPEHPLPAPLDDCYAALAWLHGNAQTLGVDPGRIAIGGESAGGGLAAALALHARDRGEYPICYQLLTYPMLDDRTGTPESPADPLTGEFVWNRDKNKFGWDCYFGNSPREAPGAPSGGRGCGTDCLSRHLSRVSESGRGAGYKAVYARSPGGAGQRS